MTTDTSIQKSNVKPSKPSANIVVVKRKRRKYVLTNNSTKKLKQIQKPIDPSEHKKYSGCKQVLFYLYDMCLSCTMDKQFKETANEATFNFLPNKSCNYVHCTYHLLVAMKCNDTSCNNIHQQYLSFDKQCDIEINE